MYEIPDNDPVFGRTPYVGAALTVGNVAKIGDLAVQTAATIAKLNATLGDLNRRLDVLEKAPATASKSLVVESRP